MLSSESDPVTPPPAPVAPAPIVAFRELFESPIVLAALERLQFTAATPVQQATIPAAASGGDLIVQAQTGSGKTLAYVIPLLMRLERDPTCRGTQGLIVAPTRELAIQICSVIKQVSGIVAPCLIGGAPAEGQRRDIENDDRIVVGTPGRLLDFIKQRAVILRDCHYFVLDEADEMLSMDFLEDIQEILRSLPRERQGLFMSATISPRVEMLAGSFLKDPKRIVIDTPGTAPSLTEHQYIEVNGDVTAKVTALCDLLEVARPRSAIIFCNTKSDTELVEVFLRRRGFDARRISSDLNQRQRDKVMARIRSKELRFLVGTDIAARGLDIDHIDLVVNYALSDSPEVYMHRTGRTGRAGRAGRAVSLIGPGDFAAFKDLKNYASVSLTKIEPASESEVLKARVDHIEELLGQAGVKIQDRDTLLAKALVEKLGAVATEPLVDLMARLTRFAVEHILKPQAKSLEDELDEAPAGAEISRRDMAPTETNAPRNPDFDRRDRPRGGERSRSGRPGGRSFGGGDRSRGRSGPPPRRR